MNIFSRWFGKKEPLVPLPLSNIEVDMHSHLIPAIDDGSKSLEESVELAKGLVNMGYKKAITTPHIMSDFYKNNPENIGLGLEKLNAALSNNGIQLEVEAAAEYYIDFEFSEKIDAGEILTFGNNYVLVECSFVEPPKNLTEVIFKLQTNGYKVILAHPERYAFWHTNLNVLVDLKDREVYFQLNLPSLAGLYSPEVKTMAEKLITHQMVDFIGSDLHNKQQLKALQQIKVKASVAEAFEKLTLKNNTL